jgi:molybdate transport system ATP-binding protein
MLQVSLVKHLGTFNLEADFAAPTPGVVVLFGRSGSGKTTLVNLIAGLARPDAGRVELDGTVLSDTATGTWVRPEERGVGYVFQDARLFPHLTVLANLRYGLVRARRRTAVTGLDEVVNLLGLERLLARRPHGLSGGERQRVALGRALLSQPRLLLLDEPLASLDAARRGEVLPYLQVLRDVLQIPMVYVSHQIQEVLQLATYMVLLSGGRALAQGTPEEVSLHGELRAVIGEEEVGAVLEGTVTAVPAGGLASIHVAGGTLRVALANAAAGMPVRVQLLARDLILATEEPHAVSIRNALTGKVAELILESDEHVLVAVDLSHGQVLARVTREAASALGLAPGTPVWVLVKAVSLHGHAFNRPATAQVPRAPGCDPTG